MVPKGLHCKGILPLRHYCCHLGSGLKQVIKWILKTNQTGCDAFTVIHFTHPSQLAMIQSLNLSWCESATTEREHFHCAIIAATWAVVWAQCTTTCSVCVLTRPAAASATALSSNLSTRGKCSQVAAVMSNGFRRTCNLCIPFLWYEGFNGAFLLTVSRTTLRLLPDEAVLCAYGI